MHAIRGAVQLILLVALWLSAICANAQRVPLGVWEFLPDASSGLTIYAASPQFTPRWELLP
jgi:hypothetical protein